MVNKMPKVKPHGTLNRQRGYMTPTESDFQCPHFMERFIGMGALNERRGICELDTANISCDYRHVTSDGTPLCLRYWYGPKYEITDEVEPKYVQKKNQGGDLLFMNPDGTETTMDTGVRAMVLLTEERPVPYIENTKELDPDTGEMIPTKPQFFSTQYEDTHEKRYDVNGEIGWYKDV
jgi:hypothetical protein